MRKQLVEIELLEKGDRVLLPDGEAVIMEDEKIYPNHYWGTIKIKWIDNCDGKHLINSGLDKVETKYCTLIKE